METKDNQIELKANEYKCAQCGNVYEFGWTEEEAKEECMKNFGTYNVKNMAIVCDDCYKEIMIPLLN